MRKIVPQARGGHGPSGVSVDWRRPDWKAARLPGRPRALAWALALAAASAMANPAGMQASVGSATLSQQGNTLVVSTRNGAAGYSALNWQQFSVPAGSAVRFDQPSAASTSINRVTGGTPSLIHGSLSSNGKLVLVNTAGITVGAGAVVDTAGFTASTVNGHDADFLSGRFGTSPALSGSTTDLVVEGRILARHGDVVLVGGNLRQSGSIEALGIGLEGGRVVLRALDEARVTGDLRARRDGAGTVDVATALGEARAEAADSRGGAIDVLGARVVLEAPARLDVSGPAGGGQVRVGGDFQGANPEVPNAQAAEFAEGARILADATAQGDGGRVVIWSDGLTRSAGTISARGGPGGGDGGFVEVSGRQLAFTSQVDTRASLGRIGRLLLDPAAVELVAGETPTTQPVDSTQLGFATLAASSADISVESTGSLTVSQALEWTQPYALSLKARDFLAVNAPIRSLGGGAVRLQTDGAMFPEGGLVTSTLKIAAAVTAARIEITAAGQPGTNISLQGADLMATAGALSLTAPTITLSGTNRLWGSGGTVITGNMSLASFASLRTTGVSGTGSLLRGDLTLQGNLTVGSGATLRMAIGQGARDQIHLVGGAAQFGSGSNLRLDLLAGVRRPSSGPHTLISGLVNGPLPALSGPGAVPGTSLKRGSLLAVVPVLVNLYPPAGGGGGGGGGGGEDENCDS